MYFYVIYQSTAQSSVQKWLLRRDFVQGVNYCYGGTSPPGEVFGAN